MKGGEGGVTVLVVFADADDFVDLFFFKGAADYDEVVLRLLVCEV